MYRQGKGSRSDSESDSSDDGSVIVIKPSFTILSKADRAKLKDIPARDIKTLEKANVFRDLTPSYVNQAVKGGVTAREIIKLFREDMFCDNRINVTAKELIALDKKGILYDMDARELCEKLCKYSVQRLIEKSTSCSEEDTSNSSVYIDSEEEGYFSEEALHPAYRTFAGSSYDYDSE